MAKIISTITGGTPPFSIVVRKVGENTGNRCAQNCTGFPIEFDEDAGNGKYYFILTDSSTPACVIDSRDIDGGVSNIDCDVVQPSFDAQLIQPTCGTSGYNAAVLQLRNIENATRYKVCYNTATYDCGNCTALDGTISGTSINIPLTTPTTPTNTGILVRVFKDNTCESTYKEYFGTIVTPVCVGSETPTFSVQEVQPYCSAETGGTVQNAILKFTNISHATRYKICYASTFTNACNSACGSSDGLVSGNNLEISLTPPAEGVIQDVTVRFINGSGCTVYKDHTTQISSPKCSENQITFVNLDLSFYSTNLDNQSGSPCITNNRSNDYDIYVTMNTPGVTESGQKSQAKSTNTRNVPNGNDVPNVFITSSINLNCGPGPFYRFQINLSRIRSKYPNVNVFSFEIYANKILGDNNSNNVYITPQTNLFSGVTMVKKPTGVGCGNAVINPPVYDNNDASRQPCYSSQQAIERPAFYYNATVSGYRRVATMTFNNTTNQLTWTSN